MAVVGVSELLILLFFAGGPFNQIFGLPPGDRDPNLVHAASADSLLYLEWSSRGEGKVGAAGVDGLAADPEVVVFFDRLVGAFEKMLARNTGVDGIETIKTVPKLVVTLTGKPGCFFWGLDAEAVAEGLPPQFAIAGAIRAGFIVNAGEDADAISDNIIALIKTGSGLAIDELDHTPLPLPAPVQIHRHNNYLIVAAGPTAIDDIINRLTIQNGGISEHPSFAAGWKELAMERTGMVAFLDLKSGVQKIGKLTGMQPMIEQGLQMAGISGIESAMSVTGVADGQIISRGHVQGITGDKGLMSLVSGRGIKANDFALVPADSDVVLAYSADARKIFDALTTYVGAMDPNGATEITASYQMLEEFLGIDFDDDVFAALDQVITFSNSPGDGGWIGSSPVLTIGIKNARSANETATKIAEVFQREFDETGPNGFTRRGVKLERRDFMETEIFMVNIIGEDDIFVAPSWCLTDTHVMIALHPQALKSRLRRVQADDWKSFGAEFDGGPAGETVAFSVIDVPSVLPQIYGFLPWVGQIIFSELQSEGFDMNLLDFPSAAAVLPYMTPSRSYLVRTPDGLSKHSEGPPVVGGMSSLTPMLFLSGISVQRQQAQFNAIELELEVEEAIAQ